MMGQTTPELDTSVPAGYRGHRNVGSIMHSSGRSATVDVQANRRRQRIVLGKPHHEGPFQKSALAFPGCQTELLCNVSSLLAKMTRPVAEHLRRVRKRAPRRSSISLSIAAVLACLLLIQGLPALADNGSGSGDGGGSGDGSGSGHSGRDGGSDHDSEGSGRGGNSDKGGGGSDDNGASSGRSDDDGYSGSGSSNSDSEHSDVQKQYNGGWLERVRKGRYQLFDPAGRTVIDRQATGRDHNRMRD